MSALASNSMINPESAKIYTIFFPTAPSKDDTDLVDKIKLIVALKKLKVSTILTVTDSPYVNVMYGDVLNDPPDNYKI
jgi:hypothetical protein